MTIRSFSVAFAALALCIFANEAPGQVTPPPPQQAAQQPTPPSRMPHVIEAKGPLKVFLDCQYECDRDFITKELTFVDHVRDSQSADIHALVTTETTGGGGTSWKIQFIGLGRFQGHDETVNFSTPQTASGDERRQALLKWLKLGLATHAALALGEPSMDVTFARAAAAASATPVDDPWNAWVFSLGTNGHLNGEESSKFANYSFRTSANRVTEAWKLNFNAYYNRSTSTFEISDTETVKSLRSSWDTGGLVAKSLGPKWSAAARYAVSGSTYSNYDINARLMAGVEYDFFPYAESTRRSLTVSYLAGVAHYDFTEETIFGKFSDTNPEHALIAALGLRQPWGSVGMQASWRQHLDDLSKNRLGIYGDADVRLFKGFSFNVFGDYSRIRDQINLRKSDVAEEEILLQLRQLQTGYQYFMGFGVTYRFGSIYNNVVNPRFRNY